MFKISLKYLNFNYSKPNLIYFLTCSIINVRLEKKKLKRELFPSIKIFISFNLNLRSFIFLSFWFLPCKCSLQRVNVS